MARGDSRLDSQDKARMAAKAALDKQAEEVLIMDLRQLSTLTDFFVIATATSRPQLLAVTEHIEQSLKRVGRRTEHVEGKLTRESARVTQASEPLSWVLLDCGDVVVHLFNPPARSFYQLERLWGDAPRVEIE